MHRKAIIKGPRNSFLRKTNESEHTRILRKLKNESAFLSDRADILINSPDIDVQELQTRLAEMIALCINVSDIFKLDEEYIATVIESKVPNHGQASRRQNHSEYANQGHQTTEHCVGDTDRCDPVI